MHMKNNPVKSDTYTYKNTITSIVTLIHYGNVIILNQKHTVTDKIPPNTITIKYTVKHTVTDKNPPKHNGH